MFTGIVRDIGKIERIYSSPGEGLEYTVSFHPETFGDVPAEGDSIAVDGVCLTATGVDGDRFRADVSDETLKRTTLSRLGEGDTVNLEPSLSAGDEIGGHFVFGHVDDVVEVSSLVSRDDYHDLTVTFSPEYRPMFARKGSVALDGISLTINEVTEDSLTVRIVPHTMEQTVLSDRGTGDYLNLEVDMLARYVYNYFEYSDNEDDSLTVSDLSEAGFIQP